MLPPSNTKEYAEHVKSRWGQPYSDVFRQPFPDTMETENLKAEILTDSRRNEFQKWHDLAELCLQQKETFYVPTDKGCYAFEYHDYYDDPYCIIRYGYGSIIKQRLPESRYGDAMNLLQVYPDEFKDDFKYPDNHILYRFGLNTHMEPPRLRLRENGYLDMTPDEIRREYTDFAPDPIATTRFTDIPYKSLISWKSPDQLYGTGGLKDTGKLLIQFEYTERQQAFIDMCKGFDPGSPNYETVMALMNKMMSVAEFQVMRNNQYAIERMYKEDPDITLDEAVQRAKEKLLYIYWCPDELCMHHAEERFVEEWNDRNLGIVDMTTRTPEYDRFHEFDQQASQKYLNEASITKFAILEYWQHRAHHRMDAPIKDKPPISDHIL